MCVLQSSGIKVHPFIIGLRRILALFYLNVSKRLSGITAVMTGHKIVQLHWREPTAGCCTFTLCLSVWAASLTGISVESKRRLYS